MKHWRSKLILSCILVWCCAFTAGCDDELVGSGQKKEPRFTGTFYRMPGCVPNVSVIRETATGREWIVLSGGCGPVVEITAPPKPEPSKVITIPLPAEAKP